ncbi:arsenate reductase [Bradyrhizobium macuxiense]|uniref:Arsenate reductase n=1 Tax=Bradyrhizobium macuxiense TaxID=1755647 RepID=A0A120FQ94_9BRAD|nr:ArsC/Spx/MgsR family protein [Bradyrhizobium macuxiense]KWV58177.1 arsenate reductase [Bradyrhizobium macuxiense]
MATIIFYQKSGCVTNARQIRSLTAAGHRVIVKDILKEPWCTRELRSFFGHMPVASWFSPSAPRIKSGEVNPDTIDAASALARMLGDPLLIRRPLIDADGARCAGFNCELVLSLLGRTAQDDLEGCSREGTCMDCPPK